MKYVILMNRRFAAACGPLWTSDRKFAQSEVWTATLESRTAGFRSVSRQRTCTRHVTALGTQESSNQAEAERQLPEWTGRWQFCCQQAGIILDELSLLSQQAVRAGR